MFGFFCWSTTCFDRNVHQTFGGKIVALPLIADGQVKNDDIRILRDIEQWLGLSATLIEKVDSYWWLTIRIFSVWFQKSYLGISLKSPQQKVESWELPSSSMEKNVTSFRGFHHFWIGKFGRKQTTARESATHICGASLKKSGQFQRSLEGSTPPRLMRCQWTSPTSSETLPNVTSSMRRGGGHADVVHIYIFWVLGQFQQI